MAGKQLGKTGVLLSAILMPLFPAYAAPPEPETQPATAPATAPATRIADHKRLEDFLMLIQGPNLPLAARRTGARELLRLGWPETVNRLAGVLASENKPARLAVALALADVPDPHDAYIEPLISMLADPDADLRHAAAAALAGYRDSGVSARLRDMMLDVSPAVLRLAAVELGAINSARRGGFGRGRRAARLFDRAARSGSTERSTAMDFEAMPGGPWRGGAKPE